MATKRRRVGRPRGGKTERFTITVYPELAEAILQISYERDMGISDFIAECVAKQVGMELPPPRWRTNAQDEAGEQMELADAGT